MIKTKKQGKKISRIFILQLILLISTGNSLLKRIKHFFLLFFIFWDFNSTFKITDFFNDFRLRVIRVISGPSGMD